LLRTGLGWRGLRISWLIVGISLGSLRSMGACAFRPERPGEPSFRTTPRRRPGLSSEPEPRPNEKTGTRALGVPAGTARPLDCDDPGARRTGSLESGGLLRAGGRQVKGRSVIEPEARREAHLPVRRRTTRQPRRSCACQRSGPEPLPRRRLREDNAVAQPPGASDNAFKRDRSLPHRSGDLDRRKRGHRPLA